MTYSYKVNNQMLSTDNQFVSGSEILELVGFEPVENFDLFKRIEGREFEPIQLDEKVDLGEPGIERFRAAPKKTISFSVDDEKYKTDEIDLNPVDIFNIIGLDSSKFYLKQIKGHMEISYKNDEHKEIRMLGHLKFITCKNEPTTVS
jgi:multiubiquitin